MKHQGNTHAKHCSTSAKEDMTATQDRTIIEAVRFLASSKVMGEYMDAQNSAHLSSDVTSERSSAMTSGVNAQGSNTRIVTNALAFV